MESKRILVTGAGTGIGRDTAIALHARGHIVFATTYSEEHAEQLRDEVDNHIQIFKLDITNADDRSKIADLELDVLINNAALGDSGSLAEVDINRVRKTFEVNVFSTLEISQVAIQDMVKRGGGTVIFISSIAGRIPSPFLMPYSMTKFALSAAAAGLRDEMKVLDKGIQISVIEPGAFHTGFNQSMQSSTLDWMKKDSLFTLEQIEQLDKKENRLFNLIESKSTKSIVDKIITASEAKKPKLRYVAPWIQGVLVRFSRILGA